MPPLPAPRLLRRAAQGHVPEPSDRGNSLVFPFLSITAPDPPASLNFDIARTIPQHLEIVREILD